MSHRDRAQLVARMQNPRRTEIAELAPDGDLRISVVEV